ncbi:LytTR family DNA-binding domain-containing protein [Celeribacter marinus]|uniref:LytTR family DNA-binding domain-containing protein n=1 Tax=Celeribacter marinus TaxID=1397108 RepID=UPI003F6B4ABF
MAIPVVLINGTKFRCSINDFWAVVTDSSSLLFFLIAGVVFGYLYPSEHLLHLEWWQIAGCIVEAVIVLLLALGFYFALFAFAHTKINWLIAPVPVLMFVSVVTMEIICRPLAHWVWGAPMLSNSEMIKLISTNYLVFLSFEILYSIFVIPMTARGKQLLARHSDIVGQPVWDQMHEPPVTGLKPASVRPAADDATIQNDSPSKTLTPIGETLATPIEQDTPVLILNVGSLRLPVETLLMIQAEEHYIRITSKDNVELVRFRFSDAVSQLPETMGLQVHRSHWLSFEAVSKWSKLPDGRLLVTLWDNRTIKVPRSRRKQFEQALDDARSRRIS